MNESLEKDGEQYTFFVSPLRRFKAFLIDSFILYIIRGFYFSLVTLFILPPALNRTIELYEMRFGKFNLKTVSVHELNFLLKSDFFIHFLICMFVLFYISALYNFLFLISKHSATLGQRFFKMHVVDKNGNKLSYLRALFRSLVIPIPYMSTFIIIFLNIILQIFGHNLTQQDKFYFGCSMIIFSVWFDLIFFTKEKVNFTDILTGTKLVNDEIFAIENVGKMNNIKRLFVNLLSYKNVFTIFKNLIMKEINFIKEAFGSKKDNKNKKNK